MIPRYWEPPALLDSEKPLGHVTVGSVRKHGGLVHLPMFPFSKSFAFSGRVLVKLANENF